MKSKYKFLITLLITAVVLNISAFSADKLYVVFDDIDNVYNTNFEQIISNGYEDLYYKPLLVNNLFTENILRSGYANFFSSGKKLTDYEVAVFWMGNKPLQYDGGSGHKVVKEIKAMLEAGKRVILIGNQLLALAYHPQSQYRDAEVQKFFEDYLGIGQNAYVPITTVEGGGTAIPFGVKGIQLHPVGKGYQKVCNHAQGPGGCPENQYFPWRYTGLVDGIRQKYLSETTAGTKAEAMELFTWVSDWANTLLVDKSDSLVGVTVQSPSSDPVQDSKIVFWTSGFEVASACGSINNWTTELWYALIWCTSDLPKPGPNISFNVDPLEFGTVAVDDSTMKRVTIKNSGRETLEVYDMYTEGFSADGIFVVLNAETSFDLEPGETRDVDISFHPDGEELFKEFFDVESNAANGELLGIELTGYGGKKPDAGPKLSVTTNILDFGVIDPSEKDTLYIVMHNPGVAPLFIMQKPFWPRETQPPFMYAIPYQWSFTIQPEDSMSIAIKFAPSGMKGTFYDTLGLIPYNAVNYKNDTLWIYLKGISGGGGMDADYTLTSYYLNIDSTEIGQKKMTEFEIENTGTKIIYISKLQVEDDMGGAFKILDKNEEDFQHKIPMQLSLAGPNKKRLFYVEFWPKEAKTYNGKILIEAMDENDKPIPELTTELPITAIGKDTISSVIDNYTSSDNLYLEIVPNPANEFAKIYYKIDKTSTLELFIVDNLGNKVMNIMSGKAESGSYIRDLNLDILASGMYFIVAYNNGEVLKVPLVLIK